MPGNSSSEPKVLSESESLGCQSQYGQGSQRLVASQVVQTD